MGVLDPTENLLQALENAPSHTLTYMHKHKHTNTFAYRGRHCQTLKPIGGLRSKLAFSLEIVGEYVYAYVSPTHPFPVLPLLEKAKEMELRPSNCFSGVWWGV